jgi:hypothetical protein
MYHGAMCRYENETPAEREVAEFLTTIPHDPSSFIRLKDLYDLYWDWFKASGRPGYWSKRRFSSTLHLLKHWCGKQGRGGFSYVYGLRHPDPEIAEKQPWPKKKR